MTNALILLFLLGLAVEVGDGKKKKKAASSKGPNLEPGKHYAATIKLTGLEKSLGSASDVSEQLTKAGFTDVKVTAKGDGVFEATGTWSGAAGPRKLPPEVHDFRPA